MSAEKGEEKKKVEGLLLELELEKNEQYPSEIFTSKFPPFPEKVRERSGRVFPGTLHWEGSGEKSVRKK
jgi:hypothetical protein